MIHAFLILHSCHCSSEQCFEEKEEMEGLTFHGPPFHIAALAIEDSAKDLLNFGKVDLGRAIALQHEFSKALNLKYNAGEGPWFDWPDAREFLKLKIEPVEFRRLMGPDWIWNEERNRVRKSDGNCGCGCGCDRGRGCGCDCGSFGSSESGSSGYESIESGSSEYSMYYTQNAE